MPESVDVVVLIDVVALGVLDVVVVLGVLLDVLGALLDVVLLVPVPLIVLELDGVELDEVLGAIFDESEVLPVVLPRVPAPAAAPALVPPGLPPWSPVPALPVVCA